MQMFSARAFEHPQASKIGTTSFSDAKPTFSISTDLATDLATWPKCPLGLWASFFKSRSVYLTSLAKKELASSV